MYISHCTPTQKREVSKTLKEYVSESHLQRQPLPGQMSNPTYLFGFPLESKIIFSYVIPSWLLHQQVILEPVSLTFIPPRRSTNLDLFVIHILASSTLFWHEVFTPGHHLEQHLHSKMCNQSTTSTNWIINIINKMITIINYHPNYFIFIALIPLRKGMSL